MTHQLDMLGPLLDDRTASRLGLQRTREVRRKVLPPLVDVPRAANADPETSHLAATNVKASGRLRKQQQLALDCVKRGSGLTSAELAERLARTEGRHWTEARPMFGRRLPELRGVYIREGDARECKVTGSKCATWWPIP